MYRAFVLMFFFVSKNLLYPWRIEEEKILSLFIHNSNYVFIELNIYITKKIFHKEIREEIYYHNS